MENNNYSEDFVKKLISDNERMRDNLESIIFEIEHIKKHKKKIYLEDAMFSLELKAKQICAMLAELSSTKEEK